MIKESGAALALIVGGVYAFGGFDAYPKTVDGAPQKVMAELADLDIRELPGEPGTTAKAAGGIMPRFVLQRAPGRLEWVVMSGAQVATRMIATFEPVEGGKQTRISASVVRGNAPDQIISPAFRSEGTTLGLFQAALDAEVAEMTAPGWGPECDALNEKMMMESSAAPIGRENPFGAIGAVGKQYAELVAAGCNPDKAPGAGKFKPVKDTMSGGGGGGGDEFEDEPTDRELGYGDPGFE